MKKYYPLICVCVLSAMLMAALALSPGLKELMDAYQVSESTASLAITLPYLISIPFTLLTGHLTRFFSKKMLSLCGTLIIIVTGLLPYFLSDFTAILFVRSLMGIGLGLLFTLAPSLAPDYYPEGSLRNLTIGMQSAWAGSGGFVFNILSGYLAKTQAKNIFLVYAICIPFFLIVLFLLPHQPPLQVKNEEKQPFQIQGISTAILTFLFISAGMTLSLSISVFLAEIGVGGSIEAGYATSAYSFAAFFFGCIYIFIEKILKNQAIFAACFISVLGMLLCVSANNLLAIYIGSAFIGTGLSIFMPSCINQIVKTTPETLVSISIAVMMVGSSVGQTFSGMLINPLSSLLGSSVALRFYVSAAIFALVFLLFYLTQKKAAKSFL